MQILPLLLSVATIAFAGHDSTSDSSSTSTSDYKQKDIVYLPKKGRFVLVKIRSNYQAYPSTCYRNGFKPAIVNRKTLWQALSVLKEACVERAWIRAYKPCKDCYFKQPKSIASDKLGGRVELWKEDKCPEAWYALCQKTKRQVCKEDTKECKKRYEGQKWSDSDSSSSSPSSSDSDDGRKHKKRHGYKHGGKKGKKHGGKKH
jgi:hypothetical protein